MFPRHQVKVALVEDFHLGEGGGGRTPYNGLYDEAPPERGRFIYIVF